jgi:peptidoglycan/LPS O-acetylase OafA/YrhL
VDVVTGHPGGFIHARSEAVNHCLAVPLLPNTHASCIPFLSFRLLPSLPLPYQGQFYLLFPLLVKLFGTGRRFIVVVVVGWLAAHALRWWLHATVMTPYMPHQFMFHIEHQVGSVV